MTLPCNKGQRRLFFQCCWCGSLHWAIMHGWWTQHYRETVTHDISTLMPAEHGGHFIILYDQATQCYTLLLLCPHQRFVATLPSPPVLIFLNQIRIVLFKPIESKQIFPVCLIIASDIEDFVFILKNKIFYHS